MQVFVNGKRINRVERYVRRFDRSKPIYVFSVVPAPEQDFTRLGFESAPKIGDTILPSVSGPVSAFNADGRYVVRKDLPKETRVVGQRKWRWKQFRGRYDSDWKERTIDVERECYPRDFLAPPSVEMSVMDVAGKLRLVSEVQANADNEAIQHAINLYLELLGQCYLTDDPDNVPIVAPKKVNWRLLPKGADPWDSARAATKARLEEASEDTESIILDRQEFVCSLGPTEVYVGEGGFADYLAYVFGDLGLVVLESLTKGNAIYIFDDQWKRFSQLSKREILAHGFHTHRIIHATGWKQDLRSIVAPRG